MDRGKCWNDDSKTHIFFYPTLEDGRREGARDMDAAEAVRAEYCSGRKDGIDCPVRFECLDHALAVREQGVWGGTTEKERDRIRRSRQNKRRKSA